MHLLYVILWGVTWGNNIAAVEWVVACAVATALLRKPIIRGVNWLKATMLREVHERLDELHGKVDDAKQIAADTHKAVTGQDHPRAKGGES